MNTALWTVQVLWGVFFSLTGFGKVLLQAGPVEPGAPGSALVFRRAAGPVHLDRGL